MQRDFLMSGWPKVQVKAVSSSPTGYSKYVRDLKVSASCRMEKGQIYSGEYPPVRYGHYPLTLSRTIKEVSPTLPTTFATHLILPSLISSLLTPAMASQAAAIVPLVVQLGRGLPGDEYAKLVLEPIVKLFASPDRGTRMALLDSLSEFSTKLDKKTVSDKIWPHLVRPSRYHGINLLM